MNRLSHPLSFLPWAAALFLSACGARSTLDLLDPDPTPTVAPPGSSAPDPTVHPAHFDCRVTSSARPMLAARMGSAVHFIYPDRSTRQVHTFDVPSNSYIVEADVVARGDRVVAYVVVSAKGGAADPKPSAEVVELNIDGTVLLHERHDFAYQGWGSDSRLVGNDQGLFVLSLFEVKAGLGLVIDDTGAHLYPERMAARTDPDAKGRLVMWSAEAPSTADLHFFDTEKGTITPSRYVDNQDTMTLASSPTLLGSGLVYLERDPSRLVFEDASGLLAWPIDVPLADPGHATPGYMYSGEYRLFMLGGQNELSARYLLTHVASGSAREFTLAPPPGLKLPADYWNPPPIDADGRVVVGLYDTQKVQIHATSNGVDWTPIGRPVTASGYPMYLTVVEKTVIFRGTGGDKPSPGTLPSWATQLIGPQGGDGVELVRQDPGAPDNPLYAEDEISADGSCVAYFRSGSLQAVQVADYSVSDLALSTTDQSAEMAWIPVPP